MKLLILCLLVFTSAGFVFGDEEEIKPNFIDLDENDDQVYEDSPENFVEDEGDDVSKYQDAAKSDVKWDLLYFIKFFISTFKSIVEDIIEF